MQNPASLMRPRYQNWAFPDSSVVEESSCKAVYLGSIPGLGRSPGEGDGTRLQYFARQILWTEGPGGLQSAGLQRVQHD